MRVLKHCKRKFSVSKTSIPEGGSGRMSEVVEEREGVGWRGCRRVVIAWTLGELLAYSFFHLFLKWGGSGIRRMYP